MVLPWALQQPWLTTSSLASLYEEYAELFSSSRTSLQADVARGLLNNLSPLQGSFSDHPVIVKIYQLWSQSLVPYEAPEQNEYAIQLYATMGQLGHWSGNNQIQQEWTQRLSDEMTQEQEHAVAHELIKSHLFSTWLIAWFQENAHTVCWLKNAHALTQPMSTQFPQAMERYTKLPWSSNTRLNQRLAQAYFPEIYPVLDIMIPSSSWNQLRLLKETIHVLSQRPIEPISMPLPENMLPPC